MRLSLLVFLLFSTFAFSQTTPIAERKYSDTLPKRFIIDKEKLRTHIFSGIPSNVKNGEYPRRALNFAHSQACYISDFISDGTIYSDWDELENYVNEVLQKVLPEELKKDSVIHLYIVKDGYFNAFMTASGHAFMNIGLLADLPDEAALASVLCHELAHYYLKHSLYRFMEAEAGNFDNGVFFVDKSRSKFSIKNELQADSLSAVWLQKSGYTLDGSISSFKVMQRLELNQLRSYSEMTLKESTHPLSQKRLDRLTDFYNQSKTSPGKNFLIDENKFNRLKEEVKPEILKNFLADFHYTECIETAFRYHLFDPDNTTYIYYILEAIRRKSYLDIDTWKKMFITDGYYDLIDVNGEKHKEPMTDHLFKKFDLEIIPIDPKDGVKLKARFYWRETKFTTYEEAFNFFYNLSQALNCHECVLSNGLSYTAKADSALRNKMLLKYLSYDDVKHKEYAQNVLKGTIAKNLKKNKLTAFVELNSYVEEGYERIPIPDKNNLFKIVVDSAMKNKTGRTYVYLPEFKTEHLNDFSSLVALKHFSLARTVAKGDRTELHILDPKYWEMFHKYNVNEIEFILTQYSEVRSKQTSVEAYQKIINTDFKTTLGKTFHTKYFDVMVTSIREIENAFMKVRYYDDTITLTSKDDTSDQMAKNIRYELSIMEKKALERDSKYGNSGK
ncbi:MAG: M48 family metallopeptidase [Bacteroidetes bacterium]|nr:M48 family metallopeptidase [Bacteroidota bacterium]